MTRAYLILTGLMAAVVMPSAGWAQAGGGISLVQAPSCVIRDNLTPVAVRVGINGGVVTPENGSGSAGSIRVVCNTLRASVFIGSNAMVNKAPINPNEASYFANRIDFAAYARQRLTGDLGWRIASRPNIARGAWQSDYVRPFGMNIDVFATNFETLTKMPIAGDYVGQICITISPSGLPAPILAQGTVGCAAPS